MAVHVAEARERRRRAKRYPVTLDAKVVVGGARPGSIALAGKARIECLSQAGARVHFCAIDKRRLHSLGKRSNNCWLVCRLPGDEVSTLLAGDIAWMNIYVSKSRPRVLFGLQLSEIPEEERAHLQRYVHELATAG
jgi:hypothetical protein